MPERSPWKSSRLAPGRFRGVEPLTFSVSKLDATGYHWRVPQSSAAVFLDRDGTLIQEKKYLSDPDAVVFCPGVGAALRRLMDGGFKLVVVTNQSGIGRGYYTEADMHRVNQRVVERLAPDGVRFERIYFAPEAPEQPSPGRKPLPHFLFDARDELGIDLARSFMVGDKRADLEWTVAPATAPNWNPNWGWTRHEQWWWTIWRLRRNGYCSPSSPLREPGLSVRGGLDRVHFVTV